MADSSSRGAALAAATLLIAATAAHAQPATQPAARLPDTTVTARLWEEDALTAPASVTVLDARTIRDSGIENIRDASFLVPNLYVVPFTARRLSFPFARGVGSGQGDPGVVVTVDGVPQFGVGSTNLPWHDIERIEAVRGGYGALYGRNALGGAINVVTAPPPDRAAVAVGGTVGNFDHYEAEVSGSTPVGGDGLRVRAHGRYSIRDGYHDNTVTGDDLDDREAVFGRGDAYWTSDDGRWEVRGGVHGERARDGGFALFDTDSLEADPFKVSHDFEGSTDRDLIGGGATARYFGDRVELTSITGGVWFDVSESSDFDFTAGDLVRRFTDEDLTQFSQELRLGSAPGAPVELSDGLDMRWLVGGIGFVIDETRGFTNTFRPDAVTAGLVPAAGDDSSLGAFDTLGGGVYGQATLSWRDKLDLTGGLRYSVERKEADITTSFAPLGFPAGTTSSSRDEAETFAELLPMVSLAYHWTPDLTTYGTIGRGFRAGGFNLRAPAGTSFGTFDTETSWTYEAGIKTRWWDDRLSLSAAAFYIQWDDQQLNLFDPTVGGFIANAGESTSRGFELEALLTPAEGWLIFANVGYTDAEFDAFTDPFAGDVAGNDVPFAPDWTWAVGAQRSQPLGGDWELFFRGELTGVSEFYYEPGNAASEDGFVLANARVGVRNGRFSIEAWVRNAFDEDYIPVAFQTTPGSFVGENGPPLTYGVSGTIRF